VKKKITKILKFHQNKIKIFNKFIENINKMAQHTERYVENSEGINWFIISDNEKYIVFSIDNKMCFWNTETDQRKWTRARPHDEYELVEDYFITPYYITNLNKFFNNEEDFMIEIRIPGTDNNFNINVILDKQNLRYYAIGAVHYDFTCYTFDGQFVNRFQVPDKSGMLKFIGRDVEYAPFHEKCAPVWNCICIDNCLYIFFYDETKYPALYYGKYDFIKVDLRTNIVTRLNFNINGDEYELFSNKTFITSAVSELKHVFSFENENEIHLKYTISINNSAHTRISLSPSHNIYIFGDKKIIDANTGATIVEFNNTVKSISCDATDSKLFLVKTENGINRLFIYYLTHIVDNQVIIRELNKGVVHIDDLQKIILKYLPNSKLLVLPLPFNEDVELLDIFDVGEEEE
jgi:hypothetical protein